MTQTIINVPAAGAFDPTDIEITDNTSGAFLIKDDAGSPTEYMRIDTTNSAEKINFKVPAGNGQVNLYADKSFGYTANGGAQWYAYGGSNNWFFGNSGTASPGYLRAFSTDFSMQATSSSGVNLQQVMRARGAGTGDAFKVKSATETNFEIDQDSNATFTLDDGSGATFTITDDNATPKLHLRCTQSASTAPQVEVNGLSVFPGKRLTMTSATYGTNFVGSINQARSSISLGATSTTRNLNIGAVSMDNFAQILTATPSTTGQTFTLDFNNTNTALSDLPIGLYKLVLKNAGTQSCTFTAGSTMAGGGRVKGVDISGASIGVIDSTSGSITAAAGEAIYVEVTNHVSDSAGDNANRFIICKTICKI